MLPELAPDPCWKSTNPTSIESESEHYSVVTDSLWLPGLSVQFTHSVVSNSFLYSSMYSCHLFLISCASARSLPFLSFIEPIFAWNVPLVSLIFWKRSLVFPILLFSSIFLLWSLRKPFLSLLAILGNSAFKWVYLAFSPLLFTSLLFTAVCKASSDSHFAFLHFFFLEMVLTPVSCTVLWSSVHSSSGPLYIRSSPLNLFSLPLYNCKGFDLGHTWMV